MNRVLSFLLLTLAGLNVASGDLLRPCQCSPTRVDTCGMHLARRAATLDASRSPTSRSRAPAGAVPS